MARQVVCDVCRKPTPRIVFKLFITPVAEVTKRSNMSVQYSGHADVGECCAEEMFKIVKWQKRKARPRKEKTA